MKALSKLSADLRLSIRGLAKSPVLAVLALASLTLGIGANSAIFSVLNAVLLRQLPIPAAQQLVHLSTSIPGEPERDDMFSWSMFQELSQYNDTFSSVFCWYGGGINNFDIDGARYRASLARVSNNYFKALEIQPFLGRFISDSEVGSGAGQSSPVAVISYRVWRTWFHADPHAIGHTLRIDGVPFTVIGVQPEGYEGLVIDGASDITVPLFPPGTQPPSRDRKDLAFTLFARLQPAVTYSQADATLRTIWPHILQATAPDEYRGERRARFFSRRVKMQSASTGISFLRSRFSRPLRVLQATAGIILFIACLNLANLFLAKAAADRHQYAVQAALGASRWDLVRPRLVESLVLSLTGGACGIALAYWAAKLIIQTAWTGYISTPLTPSVDLSVLAFTTAVSLCTAILFGIAPAFYAGRVNPIDALKREARSMRGGVGTTGKLLIVVQIAMSVMLVGAALLFARTLNSLRTHDAGYRRDHLLTFILFPQPGASYPKDLNPYYEQLADKVRHLPGVEGVSYSQGGPANQFEWFSRVSRQSGDLAANAINETVARGFFSVAGMRMLAGRDFQPSDVRATKGVAIISQSLANHLFGDQNPIGQIVQAGPHAWKRDLTIVGVVNSASLWKVESVRPMALYSLFGQARQEYEPILDVRTAGDESAMKPVVERAIRSFGYHDSLRSMTVEERLDSYITVQRLTASISAFFGALALLIACAGVYGLTAFHAASRTAELGIRSALGARRTQLMALVLRESMLLASVGCACGLVASSFASRWIGSLVFGVAPASPLVLLSAVSTLLSVAALAGLGPSWRAAKADPTTALRSE